MYYIRAVNFCKMDENWQRKNNIVTKFQRHPTIVSKCTSIKKLFWEFHKWIILKVSNFIFELEVYFRNTINANTVKSTINNTTQQQSMCSTWDDTWWYNVFINLHMSNWALSVHSSIRGAKPPIRLSLYIHYWYISPIMLRDS